MVKVSRKGRPQSVKKKKHAHMQTKTVSPLFCYVLTYIFVPALEACLQRLETQIVGITHMVCESGQVFLWLGNVELAISRISRSLKTFLSRIQIEEDMWLIPTHHIKGPAESLNIEPQMEIEVDMYPMEGMVDPQMMTDENEDTSRSPIPTPGTPSKDQDDGRMIQSSMVGISASASAAAKKSNVDQTSACLPPPPTVNVIPPTPQNSQTGRNRVHPPQAEACPSPSPPLLPSLILLLLSPSLTFPTLRPASPNLNMPPFLPILSPRFRREGAVACPSFFSNPTPAHPFCRPPLSSLQVRLDPVQ